MFTRIPGSTAPTDFEELRLTLRGAAPATRSLILTTDFEAFRPATMPAWCSAMRHWALRAEQEELQFCFFVALENVVGLRENDEARYQEFLDAVRVLHRSGAVFQPHNHYLFDPETGLRPPLTPGLGSDTTYRKRQSMFYDVVYRRRADLSDWFRTLRDTHARFLDDAGVPMPAQGVFRAGGWDYGSSVDDLKLYIGALRDAGFSIDSSASAGAYSTSTWRAGAPFGSNVFWLAPDLLEVAATWSLDCGSPLISRASADSLRSLLGQTSLWHARRQPGAFVTVLHFDHLFRDQPGHERSVTRRIDQLFTRLGRLRIALRAPSDTFESLEVA